MYVEKKICDVDGKLTIYLGNLKRLNKRLDILQQVHDAPKVYGQFVTEIVRRRQFSHKFLSVSMCVIYSQFLLHAYTFDIIYVKFLHSFTRDSFGRGHWQNCPKTFKMALSF